MKIRGGIEKCGKDELSDLSHTFHCLTLNSAHSAIAFEIEAQISRQWFSTPDTHKTQSFLKVPVFGSPLRLIKYSGDEIWLL